LRAADGASGLHGSCRARSAASSDIWLGPKYTEPRILKHTSRPACRAWRARGVKAGRRCTPLRRLKMHPSPS
jgi:hypothetical protein